AVLGRLRQRRPPGSVCRRIPGQRHALSGPSVQQCTDGRGHGAFRRRAAGALDLALTNNDPAGGHYLFRNQLPAARAQQSLSIDVVDARGRHTKPGAEVRVYAAGTRRLLAAGLVDSGGGYCSQNVMPVHVAAAGAARVDVEVTTMGKRGRQTTRVAGVVVRTAPRPLVLRISD